MANSVPYEPLTPREREILKLLCQRLSDKEIAERLFVALSTVKWYNRHVFSKLGAENRKHAIRLAAEFGLLDAPDAPKAEPKHNLPAQLTPFIGRSDELADLRQMLSHPRTRLVTILAPGGMGKTRLALEAAGSLLDLYADGVYFAALAGLTDSDQFVSTAADALGFQFMPDGREPKQQVLDFLRRKHALVVLDNFEHLLDAAPTVASWLTAAPRVKVLVTSREKLSLSAETVYPLTGLHYPPDDADEPTRYGAVQLFIECVLRANPRFEDYDTESIARVCRIAQGMPLAIELAAAWAGTLSVGEIANEVSRSADFLQSSMRDVPERQLSVRAVFEAAWARLDEDARRAFRRMSVFRGGCTREAAQTITGASIETLSALVDKALLWYNPQTGRYEVHELLRRYAEGELESAGESDAARQAHLDYYGPLADEWAHAMQRGKQLKAFAMLDPEIDNIRLALERAIGRGIPDEIGRFTELIWYSDQRGWWMEYVAMIRAAAESLEPHDSVALAECLMYLSVYDTSRPYLNRELAKERAERALDMLRRLEAREILPMALMTYADSLSGPEVLEQFDHLIEEGFSIAEEYDDPPVMGALWLHYAATPEILKNWPEATARVREAYRCYSQVGNVWGMCHALNYFGLYATKQRDFVEAERCYEELMRLAKSTDFDAGYEWGLFGLAFIAREQRDWPTVRKLNAEILRIRRQMSVPDHHLFQQVTLDAETAVMLGAADEARRYLRDSLALMSERALEIYFERWLMVAAGYLILREGTGKATTFLGYLDQRGDHGGFTEPFDQQNFADLMAQCRAALTPEEFAAAVGRGRALTEDAIIAELTPLL